MTAPARSSRTGSFGSFWGQLPSRNRDWWLRWTNIGHGILYPWWYLVMPEGARGPWVAWWAVSAWMLLVGMGGERLPFLRRHPAALQSTPFFAISTHLILLTTASGMHPFAALGAVVTILAFAGLISSTRIFLAFSIHACALVAVLSVLRPNPLALLYWTPVALVLPLFYMRLRRQLRAEHVVQRCQQDLETLVEERTKELSVALAEREELEVRLRTTQKLEAVARLAGGVAHDFNNLLTTILGHAEILRKRLPPGSRAREDVERICGAADRAAGLTAQLLTFSRQDSVALSSVDLNAVLGDLESMIRAIVPENVETRLLGSAAPAWINANRNQIDQIVFNLALNARDAMPEGGSFALEIRTVKRGELAATGLPDDVAAERIVVLVASDTGEGMDPETVARAFDPFFTTKEVGVGTGLGLSTVHGILQQSGGGVRVESEPGRGTRFFLYWPEQSPPEPVERVEPTESHAEGQGERILVVEDDRSIRHLMERVLTWNGYDVLSAPDAETALRVGRERGSAIELMVTDVVMPRMSGVELAQELSKSQPRMKVLFVSGHLEHPSLADTNLGPASNLLPKPFFPRDLTARVHELLSRE